MCLCVHVSYVMSSTFSKSNPFIFLKYTPVQYSTEQRIRKAGYGIDLRKASSVKGICVLSGVTASRGRRGAEEYIECTIPDFGLGHMYILYVCTYGKILKCFYFKFLNSLLSTCLSKTKQQYSYITDPLYTPLTDSSPLTVNLS